MKHKITRLGIGLATAALFVAAFQNCARKLGQYDDPSGSCYASHATPTFYINGVEITPSSMPATLPANQDAVFGASFVGTLACGPLYDVGHWIQPDGSSGSDYCFTLKNLQPGTYTAKFVSARSACEVDQTPLIESLDFTVQ